MLAAKPLDLEFTRLESLYSVSLLPSPDKICFLVFFIDHVRPCSVVFLASHALDIRWYALLYLRSMESPRAILAKGSPRFSCRRVPRKSHGASSVYAFVYMMHLFDQERKGRGGLISCAHEREEFSQTACMCDFQKAKRRAPQTHT